MRQWPWLPRVSLRSTRATELRTHRVAIGTIAALRTVPVTPDRTMTTTPPHARQRVALA